MDYLFFLRVLGDVADGGFVFGSVGATDTMLGVATGDAMGTGDSTGVG
jgi:hypothetical protein